MNLVSYRPVQFTAWFLKIAAMAGVLALVHYGAKADPLHDKAVTSQHACGPALVHDTSDKPVIDQTSFWENKTIWGTDAIVNTDILSSRKAIWGSGDTVTDKSDLFIKRKYNAFKSSVNRAAKPETMDLIVHIQGSLCADYEDRLKNAGGVIYNRLKLIHSLAVRISVRQLHLLAKLPFVTHLSEDVVTKKHDEFVMSSTGAGIANQQYGVTGRGVTVAVLDSGITPRPDLNSQSGVSRILASVCFVPNETSTEDSCGHGTHVAGLLAGNGCMSSGNNCYRTFTGVAQDASLVNVRVLDANGLGTVSSVISGIQWCIDNKDAYNIRVINLSLGHPVGESYTTDPLCLTVEQAWKSGIVVVCAAGNDGRLNATQTIGLDNEGWGTSYNSINVPGNDPYVITVGCTKSMDGARAHDTISTFSGRGPTTGDLILKPDIVAPGNRVISLRTVNSTLDVQYGGTNTIPLNYYMNSNSPSDTPQYFQLSGTSMAAPAVSGAAALLLQADPGLTPDTIKARLMISADKWGFPNGLYDPLTYGAGYLNIPAALTNTAFAMQAALSPSLLRDSSDNIYLNQVIWGDQIIWGVGINDLSAIWGSQVIWGSNTFSKINISWGVQGSQIIWGGDQILSPISADNIDATSIFGED